MATRRKRNLNFLPAESRTEPVIDISAYPVDIGVGELMRLTRERLGHELQTVANQLRIRLSYLEAIEDARFRDLPGTTYAVGFVRSYADYLGLDGADIVRRFREEAARIHGQTKLVFPALTAEGKLPRAAVLLVSAVGLAVVYGVWYYISSRQQSDLPVITDVPDRLAALAPDGGSDDVAPGHPMAATTPSQPEGSTTRGQSPMTAPSAGQMPAASIDSGAGTANAATPRASIGEVPAPATNGAGVSTLPPAATAAVTPTETAPAADVAGSTTAPAAAPALPVAPAVAANDIPAAPTVPGIEGQGGAQQEAAAPPAPSAEGVVLEARMDSWIKVVDANGKTVTSKILKAGERYVVPDRPGLVLRTGNAGGLDVLVNGRKAPPLGEVGAVLTKISLAPDRLLDGTAVAD